MLPFNLTFKRRYKKSLNHALLEEYENVTAFYYQLYLDKLGKTSKPHPQLKACQKIITGIIWYNAQIWQNLNFKNSYKRYIRSKQYAYKEGGIIQITNLRVMFKYHFTSKKKIL